MYKHISDAIRAPALIELDNNLYAIRFESMKIYSVQSVIENLLKKGVIKTGDTLIDSSSGLYGYALALACHKYRLGCCVIASSCLDLEMQLQIELLGAKIYQVASSNSLAFDQNTRIAAVKKMLQENPRYHWMQQYHNKFHYDGYRKIAEQLFGEFNDDHFVIVGGVGSGCSTGGITEYLRKEGKEVQLVGVQPFGSISFSSQDISDEGGLPPGIGSAIPFQNIHYDLYDVIHWMSFQYMQIATIKLMQYHAIFSGLSSGASYLAARWEFSKNPSVKHFVIIPDQGQRYIESTFKHHKEFNHVDLRHLSPYESQLLEDIKKPWTRYIWNRQTYQPLTE